MQAQHANWCEPCPERVLERAAAAARPSAAAAACRPCGAPPVPRHHCLSPVLPAQVPTHSSSTRLSGGAAPAEASSSAAAPPAAGAATAAGASSHGTGGAAATPVAPASDLASGQLRLLPWQTGSVELADAAVGSSPGGDPPAARRASGAAASTSGRPPSSSSGTSARGRQPRGTTAGAPASGAAVCEVCGGARFVLTPTGMQPCTACQAWRQRPDYRPGDGPLLSLADLDLAALDGASGSMDGPPGDAASGGEPRRRPRRKTGPMSQERREAISRGLKGKGAKSEEHKRWVTLDSGVVPTCIAAAGGGRCSTSAARPRRRRWQGGPRLNPSRCAGCAGALRGRCARRTRATRSCGSPLRGARSGAGTAGRRGTTARRAPSWRPRRRSGWRRWGCRRSPRSGGRGAGQRATVCSGWSRLCLLPAV